MNRIVFNRLLLILIAVFLANIDISYCSEPSVISFTPPPPRGTEEMTDAQRLEWIFTNIKNNPDAFEYLKARYLTFQEKADSYKFKEIADRMKERIKEVEEKALSDAMPVFDIAPGIQVWLGKVPTINEIDLPAEWFYLNAALAWGERSLPITDNQDGGRRYLEIFNRWSFLRKHPDLFRRIVKDYCIIMYSPLSHRRRGNELRISTYHEVMELIFKHFLPLEVIFKREPSLHSFISPIKNHTYLFTREEFVKISKAIEEEEKDNLYFVRRFVLTGIRGLQNDNTYGLTKQYVFEKAKQLIETDFFKDLPDEEKKEITDWLESNKDTIRNDVDE